jgi:multidrug efflux pump subunit AcrA (membrane-fusion protein)
VVASAGSAAAAVLVADSPAAAAVPESSRSGWGRSGHRRAVLISAVVLVVILAGGVAAWAEVNGSSVDYRMASVTKADIGTTLTVVGNVEPVSDAAAAFQVGGQVATLTATPGQQVTAGQSLGTLDTTALSESVSSAQSTLSADEAKLVEDEESQASAASGSKTPSSTPSTTTTTTTTPGHGGTGTSGPSATITADQTTLTQDQSTLSNDQQQEGADLAQAQSDCTSANTGTPAGQAACESALQTVSTDEQLVSKDQTTVSKDETALGAALAAESSGTSGAGPGAGSGTSTGPGTGSGTGGTGNSGSSPTQGGHALSAEPSGFTGNSGTGTGGTGTNGGGSSADTDTPEQIASDQADIDTAEANLIGAEQSLDEATLTSPISGTVVSVGIDAGETVSADSATDIITIIGTKSYEVQATLDSSQVPSVKVGQSSSVEVDGVDDTLDGTVSQVGPVQSGDSGFDYPVIVALPSSAAGVLFAGSTANVDISTGAVSNVVAVPTSAVQTLGTRSYVLELAKGELTRKFVKVGMVGDTYTQVLSGLTPGQSVVLADYAEAVPSSNTDTVGGVGSFLNGGGTGGAFPGGGAFFGGGGGFRVQRNVGGGASVSVKG